MAWAEISAAELEERVNLGASLASAEWQALSGDFAARADRFYTISTTYLYHLLPCNASTAVLRAKLDGFDPGIVAELTPGRHVLDFGAGLGTFCVLAHERGCLATYYDLPGPHADFAAWRFVYRHLPIPVIRGAPHSLTLSKRYDVVFSDAVMEHLADPLYWAGELADRVAPGGCFICLIDPSGPADETPMHARVHLPDIFDRLYIHGLTPQRWLYHHSIWRRPL